MKRKPTTIAKQNLALWFEREGVSAPDDLFRLATDANTALKAIDHPSNQNDLCRRLNAETLTIFTNAAAAYSCGD